MQVKESLDMCTNEIKNAVLENLTEDPTELREGMIYYNTYKKAFMYYNGTTWKCMDPAQIFKFGKGSEGVLQIMMFSGGDGTEPSSVINVPIMDASAYDAAGKAAEAYAMACTRIEERIAALVNSAPENLDTLGELATAMEENEDVLSALRSLILESAHKSQVYCPELTPTDGVCTWLCNHGLTFEGSAVLCDVFTASGEKILCDVSINSPANVLIKIASEETISEGSYYAVIVG